MSQLARYDLERDGRLPAEFDGVVPARHKPEHVVVPETRRGDPSYRRPRRPLQEGFSGAKTG